MGENYTLGMDCKLYRCATALGVGNRPDDATWIEVTNIRDANFNGTKDEADVTTRANNGFKATVGTLKDGSVDFEMIWKDDDADIAAFADGWVNNTEIACAIMDRAITTNGAEGFVANFNVMDFSRSEPLADGVKVKVTLKPSSEQEWYIAVIS